MRSDILWYHITMNMRTFQGHPENTLWVPCKHIEDTLRTPWEHSENTESTLRTPWEHFEDTMRTLWGHSENTLWTPSDTKKKKKKFFSVKFPNNFVSTFITVIAAKQMTCYAMKLYKLNSFNLQFFWLIGWMKWHNKNSKESDPTSVFYPILISH